MNKISRALTAICLALFTLCMVLPTVSTASADSYSSNDDGLKTTAYVVGGIAVVGIVTDLVNNAKHPRS